MSQNATMPNLNRSSAPQKDRIATKSRAELISAVNAKAEQAILGFFDCLHLCLKGFENDLIEMERSSVESNYARKIGVFRQYIDYVNGIAENLSSSYIAYQGSQASGNEYATIVSSIETARKKLLSANNKILSEIARLSEN